MPKSQLPSVCRDRTQIVVYAVVDQRQYDRLRNLATVRLSDRSEVRGSSQEDVDNAKAAIERAQNAHYVIPLE